MPHDTQPPKDPRYGPGAAGEDVGAWYRAAAPAAQPAPQQQTAPRRDMAADQRRRHRRTKAVTLTVCGILVCAALAVVTLNSSLFQRIRDLQTARSGAFDDAGTDFDYSFGSDSDSAVYGGTPERQYDDFREYFENYYSTTSEIGLPAAPTGTGVTLKLNAPKGESLSLQEVYDKVSPAVVGITSYIDEFRYSWGTGVVFDAEAGYLITNTHILQGCTGAKVTLMDGRELDAQLVGADEASDIAVLQVQSGELDAAEFGRSASLRVGDEVSAIGNPLSQAYTGTMTNGIISAIDRNVTYGGHTMTLLQTNAALNEGNSGGPLIDTRGQIIGITNMKIMSSYMVTVEGIGFAIPSAVVKQIADQLMDKGYVPGEPTIGIVAGPVGREAMDLYDLPEGVYVTEVSEGSDALEKGLMEGDVITHVNGTAVSTVAEVNLIKEDMAVGDTLTLTVYREGESFEMEIALVDKGAIK